jgi:hypothetical protein
MQIAVIGLCCALCVSYTGPYCACVCLPGMNEPISFFINFGISMLLGLIINLNLTVLQSAKMTFVQISEVVMAVASLDGHNICLVTD